MTLILRGCQKCGGDIYVQLLVGNERESACLQCGWRGQPRRAPVSKRPPKPVVPDWGAEAVDALRRVG